MKKQFTIKAVETSKNLIASAAKNESNNLLKFFSLQICCEAWNLQGTAPKTAFSL